MPNIKISAQLKNTKVLNYQQNFLLDLNTCNILAAVNKFTSKKRKLILQLQIQSNECKDAANPRHDKSAQNAIFKMMQFILSFFIKLICYRFLKNVSYKTFY